MASVLVRFAGPQSTTITARLLRLRGRRQRRRVAQGCIGEDRECRCAYDILERLAPVALG